MGKRVALPASEAHTKGDVRCAFPLNILFAVILLMVMISSSLTSDRGIGGLDEVALADLSDGAFGTLGRVAFAMTAADWKHAETDHFIYHSTRLFVATAVSVEAEFSRRAILSSLGYDPDKPGKKSHIYIFDRRDSWEKFQRHAALDPWTGGIQAGNELFFLHDTQVKFKGNTLAHEIAHLVLHELHGSGTPLWLNEGFAEFAAARAHASHARTRGFRARPLSQAVDPARFIPLKELVAMRSYPAAEAVETFYHESERLVRYLFGLRKAAFPEFLRLVSTGKTFEEAVRETYRITEFQEFERAFMTYATKEHGSSLQD